MAISCVVFAVCDVNLSTISSNSCLSNLNASTVPNVPRVNEDWTTTLGWYDTISAKRPLLWEGRTPTSMCYPTKKHSSFRHWENACTKEEKRVTCGTKRCKATSSKEFYQSHQLGVPKYRLVPYQIMLIEWCARILRYGSRCMILAPSFQQRRSGCRSQQFHWNKQTLLVQPNAFDEHFY